MTNVRSLLQIERAARRIDHPQALYSATGTLECSVCKLPFKSDIEVWNKHLKSTQHVIRAERLRVSSNHPSARPLQATAGGVGMEPSQGGKKRKADDDQDEEGDDSRKRTRPEDLDSRQPTKRKVSVRDSPKSGIVPPTKRVEVSRPSPIQITAPPPPPISTRSVDENEWAAFEASLARVSSPSPPPTTAPTTALTAAATIMAAPLTAAQLAAQSREEVNLQSKEQREAEVEGEKEDAARQLEQEFDEMEELEGRVRRLRELREKLRLKRAEGAEQRDFDDGGIKEPMDATATAVVAAVEREDESEDDEDFDQWGAWGRT